MEKFIVSARKYRPQDFATVVGQQHITTTLKNAIQNNTLAHAFLFCGPRGVGKTTCARILAKTINCDHRQPDGEACNLCPSCTSFNNGTSLNIHELDAASNNSVDDIRELVTQVRFAPQEGKYKIYIIDEVHMLSTSAFNAFLKTLEEPPSYAKFILATTEKHKIIPTILSRCQIFDFKRITNADTVQHLQEITVKEGTQAEAAALHLIAQKSEGCMRDALSMLDKIVSFTGGVLTYTNTLEHLNLLDEDYFFRMLEALMAQDLAVALLLYDEINRKGFEGDTVLNGFAEFLRNLMICKDQRAAQLLDVIEGMQEKYAQVAAGISLSFFVSGLNVLGEAEAGFRTARNKRLFVELCLIKLCYLQQAIELNISAEGQVTANRRVGGPVAAKRHPVEPVVLKAIATPQIPAPEARLTIQASGMAVNTPPENTRDNIAVPIAQNHQYSLPADNRQIGTSFKAEPVGEVKTTAKRGSLLDSLKQQHLKESSNEIIKEKLEMSPETVKPIWDKYIEKLRIELKHISVTSFQIAKLQIFSNELVVKSATVFNNKSIEAELINLLQIFKSTFHNPDLTITLLTEDDGKHDKQLEPRHLNSQERFQLMATDYPLVKELKDRLKLELKY